MNRFTVLYEKQDQTTDTFQCDGINLLDCINSFQKEFGEGSWEGSVIDWGVVLNIEIKNLKPSI